MERCEQCGTKMRDAGMTTALGRRLCNGCGDGFVGATIGSMQNDLGLAISLGYSPEPGRPGGILNWVRQAVSRRRQHRGPGDT